MNSRIRNLRMWWLASWLVMLALIIAVVSDTGPDFLDATIFFAGLAVCIVVLSAVYAHNST